jgi:hypothetical protein
MEATTAFLCLVRAGRAAVEAFGQEALEEQTHLLHGLACLGFALAA